MKIEHFEVRDAFLRKYVNYYYLLSTVDDTENTTYLAFPSCNSPLGFFKNASFFKLSNRIKANFLAESVFEVSLVGNFLKPLQITFEPNILEFSVVFKPLGINYFVRQNLGKAMSKAVSPTNDFDEIVPMVKQIIEGVDMFDELENGLRLKFASNKQLETLQSIIETFQNDEYQLSVQQISTDLQISTKQFFRLFKTHLGINPTQYRQLLRFRHALTLSLKNCQEQNLTEVGIMAGYYDQPHFIKEFKRITNLTPRDFLGKVSLEANDKIVWQFFSQMSDSYNQ